MPNAIQILQSPLPYAERLLARPLDSIDLLVIHCTELPDLCTAREFGEKILYADSGTGNSGHFYIDRDGSVHCFAEETRIAHHCKKYNERSLGIELVNIGRYPDWFDTSKQTMPEAYTDAQIASLSALIGDLQQRIPSLRFIAGHDQLDGDSIPASDNPKLYVKRKLDPGPLFPWGRIALHSNLLHQVPP